MIVHCVRWVVSRRFACCDLCNILVTDYVTYLFAGRCTDTCTIAHDILMWTASICIDLVLCSLPNRWTDSDKPLHDDSGAIVIVANYILFSL